ncbi:MAG: ATP-binding protein [Candidatus Methanoperedens sp.]
MMKILVVDDNQNDRMMLREMLAAKNYEVTEACNGIEALESVAAEMPALIISDIMMPGMDGFTLLRELKKNDITKDIPVVFYSAHFESEMDRELAVKLGASRFIVKPTKLTDLMQEIEAVIREYEAGKMKLGESLIKTEEEYLKQYSERIVSKLEEKIVQLEREIAERRRAEDELKKTLTALARSSAELEQFVHLGSRDLQQPLKTVLGNLELICQRNYGKFDKEDGELFAHTLETVARMQKRNNDLIAYSRVGTHFETADCNVMLNGALLNLKTAIKKSGAVVTHDELPVVTADKQQLVQLFHNLVDNPIRFKSDEQPRIHIAAVQDGNEWLFSVRDNGIGIDPKFHDSIFLISQRIYGKESESTGLGLAICKKIVERHGGRIWVESKPGEGSTFYFTLPVRDNII